MHEDENVLNHGHVEVDHYLQWLVEILQLPQVEHPLLGLLDSQRDVIPSSEVLRVVVPRNLNDSTLLTAESHMMRRLGLGWAPLKVYYHLYIFLTVQHQVVLSAPRRQVVDLLPVGRLFPYRM